MYTFPNMLIAATGDPTEVRACMRYLVSHPGPSYLRLGKEDEPTFHLAPPEVKSGCWLKVCEANDKDVFLITGAGLQIAMDWIKTNEWSDRSLYSLPLWTMPAKAYQSDQLCDHENLVTVEDHVQDGGFWTWLVESIARRDGLAAKIKIKAFKSEVFGTVGSQSILNNILD